MKTTVTLILSCALLALAARPFVVDKIDPEAAGMSQARLARIADRMKEFITAGKTAGVVTLVARHGHVGPGRGADDRAAASLQPGAAVRGAGTGAGASAQQGAR